MLKDELYRAIETALAGRLDRDAFELCAVDLLGEQYPGLTPIPGGNDAGMDGAIPAQDSEPFPLVATTGKKVIGNLTKSLDRYVAEGGEARSVVVATSQSLSAPRIRNLRERAKEKSFKLLGVHEATDFALRLYRRPEWCRELLGVAHRLPALSTLSRSTRPTASLELVGRKEELEWLEVTHSDVVVYGQPGSGKTYLLQHAASRRDWRFVVSDELDALANSIRAHLPAAVVLEDAHARITILENLLTLRDQLDCPFLLVCDAWPSGLNDVQARLNLPSSQLLELQPLDRPEVAQVVRAFFKPYGRVPSDWFLREVLEQSAGRPGLAVVYCELGLRGEVEEVISGQAALRSFEISQLLDAQEQQVLAAFALGGSVGLPIDKVANALQLPEVDVRATIVSLGAGGVINDLQPLGTIAVRPAALREALVGQTFFSQAPLDPGSLIEAARLEPCLGTLIRARGRGADVPRQLLQSLLMQTSDKQLWRAYASLGSEESAWALHRPGPARTEVAGAALEHLPEPALRALLEEVQTTSWPGNDRLSGRTPIREMHRWVRDGSESQQITRRQVLIDGVARWLRRDGDPASGLAALHVAVQPGFSKHEQDIENPLSITLTKGLAPLAVLNAVDSMWPDVLEALPSDGPIPWAEFSGAWLDWLAPTRTGARIDDATRKRLQRFGRRMVEDLLVRYPDDEPLRTLARQTANYEAIQLDLDRTGPFSVLYPGRVPVKDWVGHEEPEPDEELTRLAEAWNSRFPDEIADELGAIEASATAAGLSYPRHTPLLVRKIAESTSDPASWFVAFSERELSADLIAPFVERAAEVDVSVHQELAEACLGIARYQDVGIYEVLRSGFDDPAVPARALGLLDGRWAESVERWCRFGGLSESTTLQLLQHADEAVAAHAAIGEWWAQPQECFRAGLEEAALGALVQSADYSLVRIFRTHRRLAEAWLHARLTLDERLQMSDEVAAAAVQGLHDAQREALMVDAKPASPAVRTLLPLIAGVDTERFRALVTRCDFGAFGLMILGHPSLAGYGLETVERLAPVSDEWATLAGIAMEAGFSTEAIAKALIGAEFGFSTGRIEILRADLETMRSSANPTVVRIADEAIRHAEEWLRIFELDEL